MHVEVAIIGQGIAGSTLALELLKRKIEFVVIDPGSKDNASSVSSGLINPITGRNFVKSWMIDELIPHCAEVYRSFETLLSNTYINDLSIVRSIDTIEQENRWYSRETDPGYQNYIRGIYNGPDYKWHLRETHSFGQVWGSYNIRMASLISDFRNYLISQEQLISRAIDYKEVSFTNSAINLDGITCDHLICAEGWNVINNPYFSELPFRPAKGEVLISQLPKEFPRSHILKFHKFFVPIPDSDHFWIGSNYEWQFTNQHPTEKGRVELTSFMDKHLKGSYQVVNQLSGIRPATKYRKPLIGRHHKHKSLYLFNGLGTKGISLAPYWSKHLIDHIMDQQSLDKALPPLYK